MAGKSLSRVAVVIGVVAIVAGGVGAPTWFAVDGTIALLTTEPVRLTDVHCVSGGAGRNSSGYCTGSWTLSNGDKIEGRLSSDVFVDSGDTFDGYGSDTTAAPTRLLWFAAQLLYAIPIGLVAAFVRFHRRRLRGAGRGLSAADESAMNARAEELRRRREDPPALAD